MTRSFYPLAIAGSLVMAAFSSCQSTGVGGSVAALPAQWKNAAGFPSAAPERDLSRWWTKFQDPVLARVISIALRNSPDLSSAASRVREARARRKAQAATLFPQVDASGSRRSSWSKTEGAGEETGHTYAAGLDASWDADLFGGNRQAVAAAGAAVEAAQENFHSAQASLAAETALAYVDLRAAEARLQVLRESLGTREETTQLARWRNETGETDALDLRQAETSLQQSRAALPSLEQSVAQAQNRLALLSGQAPGALDGVLSGKSGIPSPAAGLAVGIPADTIRQRPDVRAAGWQWVAAVARTRSAEADRLPSLRLSGSLGVNSLSAGKIFNPQTATASLISSLTAPVFNAGRIRAQIVASSEQQEQALLAYQSAVLVALSDVEDELIACRRSAERMATLEKAAVSAREADRLARLQYRTGDADMITVLDAQRTNLAIEDSLVSVRADRAAAYVRLYKALGGGWGGR